MPTRAATAREAAFIASSVKLDKSGPNAQDAGVNAIKDAPIVSTGTSKKRKTAPSDVQSDHKFKVQVVKGGWDELPHNIGKLVSGIEQAERNLQDIRPSAPITSGRQMSGKIDLATKVEESPDGGISTDTASKGPRNIRNSDYNKPQTKRNGRGKTKKILPITPASSDDMKFESTAEELEKEVKGETEQDAKPDLAGIEDGIHVEAENPKRKRAPRIKKKSTKYDIQDGGDLLEKSENITKKPRKAKANPYGLTPGVSPFPDFVLPTVETCKEVEDLLSEVHGKVEAPKEIPAPSLEVTGCGEVPSVLDALIRTRLSASTTTQNAKYAFTGLVSRYGVRTEGIGAGSVDWNKVRESDVLDIEQAIKKGGLARTKSISIKKILEMVHDINTTRRDAFIKERTGADISHITGANNMTKGQKDMEISTAEQGVLSLDFMHGLTADEAMLEFVKYPGIGVKTASCVILFCLQRPSFAVDTHVWRFCKWLKWVPEGASRDQTFSHCEVRIPNEMKYSLHQLFIRHGKTCGRCRAITGETSEVWEDTICPLENLVERTGKRKVAIGAMVTKEVMPKKVRKGTGKGKGKGKGAVKAEEWDGDSEMSDGSDSKDLELDDDNLADEEDE